MGAVLAPISGDGFCPYHNGAKVAPVAFQSFSPFVAYTVVIVETL
jgi:hypothetical protein